MSYKDHMKQVIINKNRYIDLLKFTKREGIDELIKFIEQRGFFVAPASRDYHNAFDGGLCDHSLKVYETLDKLVEMFGLYGEESYTKENVIISALLHDLCKIGLYETAERWRKDANNKWEKYPGYNYKTQNNPLGHGSKSVIMAQTFIKLEKCEVQAIFWHMGLTTNDDSYGYSNAAVNHKIVTLMHTADMQSSYLLEPQGLVEELVSI